MIRCKLFGHAWEMFGPAVHKFGFSWAVPFRCTRCGKTGMGKGTLFVDSDA